MRGQHPADAKTRCEGLRERTQVDDAIGFHGTHGGQGFTVDGEQTVGVVLDYEQVQILGHLQDLASALGGLGDAGGIVEIGDRVQELHPTPLSPQRYDGLTQCVGVKALIIHGHVGDLRLVGLEGPERTHIAGGLHEHHIVGIAEDPRHQIEPLLRSGRDDHIIGVGPDLLLGHDLADLFTDLQFSLPRPVLHDAGTVALDEFIEQIADLAERKIGDIGHSPGERHHFGPVGHGEQGSNRRGGHFVRALRVTVYVMIQPRVGGPTGGRQPRRVEGVRIGHGALILR